MTLETRQLSCKDILYFDIETSMMLAWIHQLHKQTVGYHQLHEDFSSKKILCISYRYGHWKKAKVLKWDADKRCDIKMLEKFNKIASDAQLLLGHNAQGFDVKELRTAIALRGLAAAWCETPCLDTLTEWKRTFRFASNRLDYVARELGVGRKSPVNIDHWIQCTLGNKGKYLKEMTTYCGIDTDILYECHKRLDFYVPPSKAVYNLRTRDYSNYPEECSANCGNTDKKQFIKYGPYGYKGKSYQQYRCQKCGKVNKPDRERLEANGKDN